MRVIIIAGGSGGHLIPALSFAEALTEKKHEVLLVCAKGDNLPFMQNDFPWLVKRISAAKIGRFFSLNNILFLIELVKGYVESGAIIKDFKPDIVAGFGGYVSVPMILAARFKHVSIILHEQNVVPGKATRVLSNFADIVALSFKESEAFFKNKNKCRVTGNVLRKFIYLRNNIDAYKYFDFDKEKFTLLVLGGSQGACIINKTLVEALADLSQLERDNLQVIHLTGEKDKDWIDTQYQKLQIKAKVFSFFKDMEYAYAAADLVISRAGATTIAELIALYKPAIIVPYPYAGRHQSYNAKILGRVNAAVVIEQENFSRQILKDCILSHWKNLKLTQMQEKFKRIQMPQGRRLLVDLAEQVYRGGR